MDLFLLLFGLIYLIIASVQDLRKREIWNWLSFSLIAFAMAYRAFYVVVNNELAFFLFGLFGLLGFVGLGYLFYYARVFAGGDAKLLWALGAVLPASNSIKGNLIDIGIFIVFLLVVGSLYGLVYSFVIALRNWSKFSNEFRKQAKLRKMFFILTFILAVIFIMIILYIGEIFLLVLPMLLVLLPLLYSYGKAVENSCLVKRVKTSELTVGDWLVSSVKVGKRNIKPDWEGLSEQELKILKNYRGKVEVKYGIPFVPSFLLSFLALVLFKEFFEGLVLALFQLPVSFVS